VDSEAVFEPDDCAPPQQTYTLSRKIAAIQLVANGCGEAQLGIVSQLLPGAHLHLCGNGFNEQTVKVRCESGFYFVFLQDIAADRVRLNAKSDQT
jgi:hypothetical protein